MRAWNMSLSCVTGQQSSPQSSQLLANPELCPLQTFTLCFSRLLKNINPTGDPWWHLLLTFRCVGNRLDVPLFTVSYLSMAKLFFVPWPLNFLNTLLKEALVTGFLKVQIKYTNQFPLVTCQRELRNKSEDLFCHPPIRVLFLGFFYWLNLHFTFISTMCGFYWQFKEFAEAAAVQHTLLSLWTTAASSPGEFRGSSLTNELCRGKAKSHMSTIKSMVKWYWVIMKLEISTLVLEEGSTNSKDLHHQLTICYLYDW